MDKFSEAMKKLGDVVAHIATFAEEHPELAEAAVKTAQLALELAAAKK